MSENKNVISTLVREVLIFNQEARYKQSKWSLQLIVE